MTNSHRNRHSEEYPSLRIRAHALASDLSLSLRHSSLLPAGDDLSRSRNRPTVLAPHIADDTRILSYPLHFEKFDLPVVHNQPHLYFLQFTRCLVRPEPLRVLSKDALQFWGHSTLSVSLCPALNRVNKRYRYLHQLPRWSDSIRGSPLSKCEPFGTDSPILTGYGDVVSLGCSKFSSRIRTRTNRQRIESTIKPKRKFRFAARRDFSEDSMKRVFLLIVVPALLVAMGAAQTPLASGNTDQINVKGCLGGSDSNYTLAEDTTGKTFKITTSSADLKAYQGQHVALSGHKEGTAENSLAVTEVNMISEHCTVAAAAPTASVSIAPGTITTPDVAPAAAPGAAAPTASISTPSDTVIAPPAAAAPAAAPDVAVGTPAETVGTPPTVAVVPVAAASPATVSVRVEPASLPAAATSAHRTEPQPRKPSATQPAKAEPAKPASAPDPVAAAPAAPVDSPSEAANDSPPAAPASTPLKPATSRSIWMTVSIVGVVLLIGGAVPLYNRWKKRKLLEETSRQNLSFSHKASSDPGRSDKPSGNKAA
jgi:hypothetical protein